MRKLNDFNVSFSRVAVSVGMLNCTNILWKYITECYKEKKIVIYARKPHKKEKKERRKAFNIKTVQGFEPEMI